MPIISPWTFYLISLVDGILWICFLAFIFCFLGAIIAGLVSMDFVDTETEETIRKWFKRFTIGAIVFLIATAMIPSEKICYQMLAAKMVTYENVGLAVEKIEEIALFLMNGAK